MCRDSINLSEGIQYSGKMASLLACLVTDNDEKISIFFHCETKFVVQGSFNIIFAL